MVLAPGTQLGPYEVESLIGSGGMGEVYRARDGRLNRTVAIKRMITDDALVVIQYLRIAILPTEVWKDFTL